ncbi:glycosyltransferase [Sphingomonas sp. MAH-20]|uniref:Glycosyltransferase n=1 Tax=Sphingomonas horti TaxID=2682842 RepID=A0A6I4IZM9_9SPHN|nr:MULTISPECIES: glycosyltransferase [Sphingomonas]MBA2918341.1 glycosyltransferase [Sphingomonas sp. CGMCC 1.13658]MVO77308.1 glycosyltransferase [Sphingomonas horti]
MKLAIFGLTVSSSWGNGHATLWRGLIRALAADGHEVLFYERDVPWYAGHRDLTELPGATLVIYRDWQDIAARAADFLDADALFVTSYCPDAVAASRLAAERGRGLRVFYDLDTPVTLGRLAADEEVDYLPPEGLGGFDLVLSYTGGSALDALERELGARRAVPLYGHVDPDVHRPVERQAMFGGDLSYLGTFAEDRQALVERLFLGPARRRPDMRFVLGGSGYPQDFPWTDNIWFMRHVAPPDHPAFFCSSRATLNVTRRDMAAMGWCPSGRLFEAAACGVPILSDRWPGLEAFFTPDEDILLVSQPEHVLAALDRDDAELRRIAARARERTLAEHSSAERARELVALLETAREYA